MGSEILISSYFKKLPRCFDKSLKGLVDKSYSVNFTVFCTVVVEVKNLWDCEKCMNDRIQLGSKKHVFNVVIISAVLFVQNRKLAETFC